MRFLNAVSLVLGSVGVCGRAAALGGATRRAAGCGFGFGFGLATATGRADWVARGVTDAVALVLGAFPVAVAAQPARAPAASRAPTVRHRHLTDGKHTRIGPIVTEADRN